MIEPSCFPSLNQTAQLQNIYEAILSSGGFLIPEYDFIDISYFGSTNNISTVVYKKDGTTVATLTLTYIGGTPASDDALIDTVTKS